MRNCGIVGLYIFKHCKENIKFQIPNDIDAADAVFTYCITTVLQYYSTEYCISGRTSSTNYSFHTNSDSDSSCDPL